MADDPGQLSFFATASLARQQAAALVRLDAQLLEAEMKEKASALALSGACGLAALVLLGMGAFVCVLGLVYLLIALGMAPFAAAFATGAILCATGVFFAWKARGTLRGWTLLPTRTVAQIRKDAEAVREALRNGIG